MADSTKDWVYSAGRRSMLAEFIIYLRESAEHFRQDPDDSTVDGVLDFMAYRLGAIEDPIPGSVYRPSAEHERPAHA